MPIPESANSTYLYSQARTLFISIAQSSGTSAQILEIVPETSMPPVLPNLPALIRRLRATGSGTAAYCAVYVLEEIISNDTCLLFYCAKAATIEMVLCAHKKILVSTIIA